MFSAQVPLCAITPAISCSCSITVCSFTCAAHRILSNFITGFASRLSLLGLAFPNIAFWSNLPSDSCLNSIVIGPISERQLPSTSLQLSISLSSVEGLLLLPGDFKGLGMNRVCLRPFLISIHSSHRVLQFTVIPLCHKSSILMLVRCYALFLYVSNSLHSQKSHGRSILIAFLAWPCLAQSRICSLRNTNRLVLLGLA